MSVSVVAEARVFPASGCFEERTVPLSILDATVANFTPTETVLAYDAPAPTPASLLEALRRVLDAYPQWCGSLHCLPFDASTRYGRLALTWGRPDDPGVVFVEACCDVALASAAPARVEGELDWDPSSFPAAQLVPSTPLAAPAARGDDGNAPPRPAVLVQATTFTCGGLAIGLRLAHPLADAHALAHFVRDWAAAARSSLPLPAPGPLFDPSLLDARAAPQPSDAAALPCNRFDWWISDAGSPFPPVSPPAELLRDGPPPPLDPPGTPMPWADWDLAAPVAHRVLHFPGPELLRLWQATTAAAAATPDDDSSSRTISRLDALLGHIWSCVTRARGQADTDEPVTLDYTLGVRARLAPPLPDRFVGSPLVIAAATAPARDVVSSSAASRLLRKTVAAFTPEAVAGHVAEKMREQSPQRLWQAFLGRRHLLVTSWIHTRLYEVEFGVGCGGGRPRLVHAAMPRLDGLVQLMEAPPKEEGGMRRQETRHWADDGVDVQVYLAADTMEKLLRDPELRKYRV